MHGSSARCIAFTKAVCIVFGRSKSEKEQQPKTKPHALICDMKAIRSDPVAGNEHLQIRFIVESMTDEEDNSLRGKITNKMISK